MSFKYYLFQLYFCYLFTRKLEICFVSIYYERTMQGLIERYMKSSRGAQPDAPIEAPPLVCTLSLSYRHTHTPKS
jgi:hypothetical protein